MRNKVQLARYLGDQVDLSAFDFRSGKINPQLMRKHRRRGQEFGRSYKNDMSLIPPIRQTASIFKQPVTIIKTQPDSKMKPDSKPGPKDKPKQVFWEKGLQNLKATVHGEEGLPIDFRLPRCFKPVGPQPSEDLPIRSLAASLHFKTQPIVGQTVSRSILEKNPAVFLNPEQPLVGAINISDEDILKQEARVRSVRRSLQGLISLSQQH